MLKNKSASQNMIGKLFSFTFILFIFSCYPPPPPSNPINTYSFLELRSIFVMTFMTQLAVIYAVKDTGVSKINYLMWDGGLIYFKERAFEIVKYCTQIASVCL